MAAGGAGVAAEAGREHHQMTIADPDIAAIWAADQAVEAAIERRPSLGYRPGRLYDLDGKPIDERDNGQLQFHKAPHVFRFLAPGNGFGKALWNEEPVLTLTGWKPIDTIKVGDFVIGGDGKPTRVLGVHPQGERDCVSMVFSDGTSVVCDLDHLWTVQTRYNRFYREGQARDYGNWETVTVRELMRRHGRNPTPVNRALIPSVSRFTSFRKMFHSIHMCWACCLGTAICVLEAYGSHRWMMR